MSASFRIILLALLILVSCHPDISAQTDTEEAIREVVVVNPAQEVFRRMGTAFHVGGGVFYTNAHVVKASVPEGFATWYLASNSSTRSRDSWLGPATVSCVHPRWRPANDPTDPRRATPFDVAVLRVTGTPSLHAFTFGAPPTVGQRVTIKGFPSASRAWPPILYTATGRVSQIVGQDQIFRIQIDSGFALPGSSGSPVFAEDGRVVGIIYAGAGEGRAAAELASAILASAALEGCPR